MIYLIRWASTPTRSDSDDIPAGTALGILLVDSESVRTPETSRRTIHLLLRLRIYLLEHGRIETKAVGNQNS